MKFKTLIYTGFVIFFAFMMNNNTIDSVTAATKEYKEEPKIIEEPEYSISDERLQNDIIMFYGVKLFRGKSILKNETMEFLKGIGVRKVVILKSNTEEIQLLNKNQINYVQIEFDSNGILNNAEMKKFLAIFKNNNDAVYISSGKGEFKGGILAMAHRMKNENWSFEKALKEFELNDGSSENLKKQMNFLKKR